MENSDTKNNKINVVFVTAIICFGFVILSSLFCVSMIPQWHGILVGFLFMLIAALAHFAAKWYSISALLNSLGCGCSIGAYYVMSKQSFNLQHAVFAAAIACLVLFSAWILFRISAKKKYVIIPCGIVLTMAVIFSLIMWGGYGEFIYSYSFFMLVIAAFYLFAFQITSHNDHSALRDVSIASFGAFAIVTFIVTVILTEGDALDVLDFAEASKNDKKNDTFTYSRR